MFSAQTTLEKFESPTIAHDFGFKFEEDSGSEIT